jgi:hypothetical protein
MTEGSIPKPQSYVISHLARLVGDLEGAQHPGLPQQARAS